MTWKIRKYKKHTISHSYSLCQTVFMFEDFTPPPHYPLAHGNSAVIV